MDMAMTIEKFNALLFSKKDDGPWLAALRQLRTIGRPEDITRLAEEAAQTWTDWRPPTS
ncbi:MAG: hypothetical protein KKA73_03185 [Chloroflexi bacterium]|nr:hypothetical protein [Chloroflexota bacterium]MBU1746668.1 hypothetical protein [Chloroflexota bacterium]